MAFLPMALAALQVLQAGKNFIKPQLPVPPGAPLGGAAGGYQPPQSMGQQPGDGGIGGDLRSLAAQAVAFEQERRRQRALAKQAELERIAQIQLPPRSDSIPMYNQQGPMP